MLRGRLSFIISPVFFSQKLRVPRDISVSYAQFEGRLGGIKALLMRHHAGDLRFIETGA